MIEGIKPTPISLLKNDPERWFGIQGGRFTRPTQWFSIIFGLILTTLFYVIVWRLPSTTAYFWFTELGKVPYFIVFFTSWASSYLLLKLFKIKAQRMALTIHIVPQDPAFVLTADTANLVIKNMYDLSHEPRDYLLFNRAWMALTSIRNFGRLGDLEDLLQAQADNDESVCDSGYTIVRGLVWAIPVLGFIGTVIGLSTAIGEFGSVVASAGDVGEIRDKLGAVTDGLSIAFVTTLQALVGALGVQLFLTMVQRHEEQLLDDSREYCQRELVSRVRITTLDWIPNNSETQ
jgi:hypothetical protein